MPNKKEFPLDFWCRDGMTPIQVLAEALNEIRQQTVIIKGFSEVLLKSSLLNGQQDHVETILERSKYTEMILDAGLEYCKGMIASESNDKG